ncbi:MAG: BON domain-containing protein [Planctomycetes bacterium]|nr:BON domain-containing protein [Planctomycetota bacterium]
MEAVSPLDALPEPSTAGIDRDRPHQLEESVQRELLSAPRCRFSSLVVRRIAGGVCLEGVLEAAGALPDIASLARRVAGVEQVLNHLVVRRPRPKG